MRRHRMPEMKEGGVNVTPLIDIVMCLIIFFMLVAKIGINTGADANITIPPSFMGQDIKDQGNYLTLNVTNGPPDAVPPEPSVTALVGNKVAQLKLVDHGGADHPLYDTLKYFREGDKKNNIAPNSEFKVIIRGDQNLQYKFLAPVLSECWRANVKNVAYATTPPQASADQTAQ